MSSADGEIERAMRAAARVARLLVVCDFDGTLAELVDERGAALPVEGAVSALERLAGMGGVQVVVLSGRGRADVMGRLGMGEGAVRVWGSYGLERDVDGGAIGEEVGLLREAGVALEAVAREFAGAEVERKPFGVVLHVRRVEVGRRREAVDVALSTVQVLRGVVAVRGKDVVEVVAAGGGGKGAALERLVRESGAGAVVCFGDDASDEEAFERARLLGGEESGPQVVTVKVGRGASVAGLRVDSPREVARWLGVLARARVGG